VQFDDQSVKNDENHHSKLISGVKTELAGNKRSENSNKDVPTVEEVKLMAGETMTQGSSSDSDYTSYENDNENEDYYDSEEEERDDGDNEDYSDEEELDDEDTGVEALNSQKRVGNVIIRPAIEPTFRVPPTLDQDFLKEDKKNLNHAKGSSKAKDAKRGGFLTKMFEINNPGFLQTVDLGNGASTYATVRQNSEAKNQRSQTLLEEIHDLGVVESTGKETMRNQVKGRAEEILETPSLKGTNDVSKKKPAGKTPQETKKENARLERSTANRKNEKTSNKDRLLMGGRVLKSRGRVITIMGRSDGLMTRSDSKQSAAAHKRKSLKSSTPNMKVKKNKKTSEGGGEPQLLGLPVENVDSVGHGQIRNNKQQNLSNNGVSRLAAADQKAKVENSEKTIMKEAAGDVRNVKGRQEGGQEQKAKDSSAERINNNEEFSTKLRRKRKTSSTMSYTQKLSTDNKGLSSLDQQLSSSTQQEAPSSVVSSYGYVETIDLNPSL
jgi:hypothetical protein